MKFPADFIDKVREANDIVDVIGQHVELKRAGASYRGLCPFPGHAERTPSFFVTDTKQVYHCFGCQKSGNVFNFMMDFSGLTFPESISALAERANIPLPEIKDNPESDRTERETKTFLKINKYVGAYFHRKLTMKAESAAHQYLKKRDVSPEMIAEFKIGFAEDSWSDLSLVLARAKAPLSEAERVGLIKKKKNGEYFDIFRNRLIFPIISATGHVLGFGGRSIDDSEPKYLNSPESPVFNKSRTLYGLHATAKHIRSEKEVFLVEGYMDLVSLYQFGIKNVVATLGTAFTQEHARAILKLCQKVIVLFDSDKAGIQAANRSLGFFSENGILSRWLILPDAKDPDEYIRKFGVEKFKALAKTAPDHFSAYLGQKLEDYRGRNTEKVEILSDLKPLIDRVRDQQLRILYLQEVAERLNLDTGGVVQQFKGASTQVPKSTNDFKIKEEKSDIPKDEKLLVQFMLESKEYVELVQEAGVIDSFLNDNTRRLAHLIVERYCQNPGDFDKLAASLLSECTPGESDIIRDSLSFLAEARPSDEADEKKLVIDCIRRVNQKVLKRRSKEILNSLKIQDSNAEIEIKKLKDFYEIAKEQKGPQRR